MRNTSQHCRVVSCTFAHRHELVGLILIIIATLLTLFTLSGLGIFAMFIVGVILCCYRSWSLCFCHAHCDSAECVIEEGVEAAEKVVKPRRKV